MRVAVDSNVLIYAAGFERQPRDAPKIEVARQLIATLESGGDGVVPVQVVGEVYNVLTSRAAMSRAETLAMIATIRPIFTIAPTTETVVFAAVELAARHQFRIWDAIVVATVADAGCALLLSEDMQDGFVWRGMTIANPFAADVHPLIASLTA